MGFMSQKLWDVLERKVEEENRDVQKEQQIGSEYLSAVKSVCKYGVDRAETIRDTFPMYTLHNEVHICNVMQLMADLLGDALDKLSRDEAAMLIMSACCHDIGMSYSEEEKEDLFNDPDRLNKYLDDHPGEYVKAFSAGSAKPTMTEDMIQNYLRSIHHERVMDLLFAIEWPSVLEGKVDRESFLSFPQSRVRLRSIFLIQLSGLFPFSRRSFNCSKSFPWKNSLSQKMAILYLVNTISGEPGSAL